MIVPVFCWNWGFCRIKKKLSITEKNQVFPLMRFLYWKQSLNFLKMIEIGKILTEFIREVLVELISFVRQFVENDI